MLSCWASAFWDVIKILYFDGNGNEWWKDVTWGKSGLLGQECHIWYSVNWLRKKAAILWNVDLLTLVVILKAFYFKCLDITSSSCLKCLARILSTPTIKCLMSCCAQKQFIDELKRALSHNTSHTSHNRALTDAAAVTCVKLCKAATYVTITDRANVLFLLVHSVNQDLKVS